MPKARLDEWPLDDVVQLKALVLLGLDPRYIGERLGYTRNAVLGKAHRLKLSFKKPIKVNNGRTRATGQYLKTKPNDDMHPTQPMPDISLCHWPIGDSWCGCKVVEGYPYCLEHNAKAYYYKPFNINDFKGVI